jgi:two-component system chemotaxis response regulator CheY
MLGLMEDEVLALIVDDSRAMRTILTRVLSSLGVDTVEADNGRTGLEALRAMPVPPDVVLVDWNMPEVDGLEFVVEVRSQPAWRMVRIMMVTSASEQGRIGRALAAGAHEYLIKPFTPDTLQERLRQLVLVAEAPSHAGAGEHVRPGPGARPAAPADRAFTSARGTADHANRSELGICDCCASASIAAFYPLADPFEQDIDGPASPIDRISVCERCFRLVETGHWSHLRDGMSPATDRRAIRYLWMELRRHRVGSPVPALPAHRS